MTENTGSPRVSRICSVPDCLIAAVSKGYCRKHYGRLWRTGSPDKLRSLPNGSTLGEALQYHGWVETPGVLETPCWIWSGPVNEGGYGRFHFQRRNLLAHRASYQVHIGLIPEGCMIRHKCDTQACINPFHLEPGTARDNFQDRVFRKGHPRLHPEKAPAAKLDWAKVDNIRSLRESGSTLEAIASHYGVSRTTISAIVRGESWTK